MEQNVLNHNRSTLGKSFLVGSVVSALTLGGLTGAYALVTKPFNLHLFTPLQTPMLCTA
jgi:hypothetical protein